MREEQAVQLFRRQPLPLEGFKPTHPIPADVDRLEAAYGLRLPDELRSWFELSGGGAPVGPGGIYGPSGTVGWLRVDYYVELHPEWVPLGWLPIAGDGNGNYYVIDLRRANRGLHPIYFIDCSLNSKTASYVVASSVWDFIVFLLEREAQTPEARRWPFDADYVLAKDPGMVAWQAPPPLPWKT